ncbi:MAG: carboxymuconolactone decarboxylase family protein [Phycisphaerales bacterium]
MAATSTVTPGAPVNPLRERAPEIGRAFAPFFQALMKEGALSVKQKELIALGIAVAVRCEECIDAHLEKCLKAGATSQEVMGSTGVAVLMGGGPAYMTASYVAERLQLAGA